LFSSFRAIRARHQIHPYHAHSITQPGIVARLALAYSHTHGCDHGTSFTLAQPYQCHTKTTNF
jgi:hypothetical protein